MTNRRPLPCSIPSCPNPGCGRARAGDLCQAHWLAWEASPEREDLRGDRIQRAPDAWFRFVERLEAAFRALQQPLEAPGQELAGSPGSR